MSGEIRVSGKYGVNPSITICPMCGKETGLALMGKLPGDIEAPRNCLDRGPCDDCCSKLKEYKTIGFVVLVINDEYEEAIDKINRKYGYSKKMKEDNKPSPWQFFHSVNVLKMEAAERIFNGLDMSHGLVFISLSLAKKNRNS